MIVSLRWRTPVVAAAVLLSGVLPGGCVTETRTEQGGVVSVDAPTRGRRPAVKTVRPAPRPRDPNAAPLPNELTDPCAVRMHDLSGLLLTYYAVNKHLPDRMEELAPFADADVPFDPTCPVSGRSSVYAPGGGRSTSGERYLVVYDSEAAHGGLRWGVFVAPPRGGQPPATWVILMSEEVFRGYVPREQ